MRRASGTRTTRLFRPLVAVRSLLQRPALKLQRRWSLPSACCFRRTALLAVVLATITAQTGCHGPLGDWLSRASLTGNRLPPQSEPDIDFPQSEPQTAATDNDDD
jgi:hypothetical protein